jgi:quercetin dioxygenase-like cupin family protein
MMGVEKIVLQKGDEFFIPQGVPHWGEFLAGTRTIHCFGGTRVVNA